MLIVSKNTSLVELKKQLERKDYSTKQRPIIFSSEHDSDVFDLFVKYEIYDFVYFCETGNNSEVLLNSIIYVLTELHDINWNVTIVKNKILFFK